MIADIREAWREIVRHVCGSPHTTDELRKHCLEVRQYLEDSGKPRQKHALREVIRMCHAKYLGDNQIPEMDWQSWFRLLEKTQLKAERELERMEKEE